MLTNFKEKIKELAALRRPKVMIGLYQGRHNETIAESIRKAQREVADIVVVGQTIEGLECVPAGPDMSDIHQKMVEVAMRDDIEGLIRGNVEEHGLLRGLKEAMKITTEENKLRIQNPVICEDIKGNMFVLGPTSTVWGRNNEEKILWTDSAIRLVGWFGYNKPKLGFLTSTRKANYNREPDSKNSDLLWSYKTWESAEYLVDYYAKKGYEAKNYEIHVEHAIADGCDIICVAEGPIGNGMFRGAFFIGGAKMVAGPRMAMTIPYEDTSQSEQDYYYHFPFLAAMINGNLLSKK